MWLFGSVAMTVTGSAASNVLRGFAVFPTVTQDVWSDFSLAVGNINSDLQFLANQTAQFVADGIQLHIGLFGALITETVWRALDENVRQGVETLARIKTG